jgi:protein involved in polysaccharide export with SLBB domain
MTPPVRGLALAILAALSLGSVSGASAQTPRWDPQQIELSRAELDSLLARFERTAAAGAYSSGLREQARREAALIRARLAEGDFQVGDQVALTVEGEESLTGAFVVQAGPALVLPQIGRVSLGGVLRSELEPHLRGELGRFIRDPVVHARSSIRLVVSGGVGKAGYHVVPTSTVFSDLLMVAGGPARDARLKEMRVERGDRVIWHGDALQQAIIEGRTLDQLSIRAGDHVVVPEKSGSGGLARALQTTGMVVGPITLLVGTLMQIF